MYLKILTAFILFFTFISPSYSESEKHDGHKHKNGVYYTCPMHPEVIQDDPGTCPICHMDLVKVEKTSEDNAISSEINKRAVVALKKNEENLLNLKFKKIKTESLNTKLKASGRALSSREVFLQVPESDSGYLDKGAHCVIESPSLSGLSLTGKVSSIDASLDPTTRTLRVLVKLDPNQKSRLRPESSVTASIDVKRGKGILAPEEAILKGGNQSYVFLHLDSKLVPKQVKLGRRFLDSFEILEGLKEGDEILSYGAFLIDSESRLRGK